MGEYGNARVDFLQKCNHPPGKCQIESIEISEKVALPFPKSSSFPMNESLVNKLREEDFQGAS
jgi:hypothetical protein